MTARFTLTPQRMRMITDAFSETLDNGLKKHGQVVVSGILSLSLGIDDAHILTSAAVDLLDIRP